MDTEMAMLLLSVIVADSIIQLILEQAQQSGDYTMTILLTTKEKTILYSTKTKETRK